MLTTFIILLEANDAYTHQRERVYFRIRLNVDFITIQAIKAKPLIQFGIPENVCFLFQWTQRSEPLHAHASQLSYDNNHDEWIDVWIMKYSFSMPWGDILSLSRAISYLNGI